MDQLFKKYESMMVHGKVNTKGANSSSKITLNYSIKFFIQLQVKRTNQLLLLLLHIFLVLYQLCEYFQCHSNSRAQNLSRDFLPTNIILTALLLKKDDCLKLT